MRSPPPSKPPPRVKELLTALAQRIRLLREQRELTQEAFAARSGISVSFASLLERGERAPSYDTLVQVSDALGVPLQELFGDQGPAEHGHANHALLQFAQQSRLTRAQVDRLIAVARAMFDTPGEAPAARRVVRGPSVCSEERCGRPVLAKGLCASHYHRARRSKG